jgi:hypothetical protein
LQSGDTGPDDKQLLSEEQMEISRDSTAGFLCCFPPSPNTHWKHVL